MAVKIYIGTEQADYEGDITAVFSAGDIRDITEGGQQSSYDFELPLTTTNKRLLKFSHEMNVFDEVTDEGIVYFDDVEVLRGKVVVLTPNSNYTSAVIVIQGSLWVDHFQDLSLRTLDLSADDHEYNATNIEASWTGAAKFYRYPMIFFSKLFSGQTTTTANWLPNDFIPMFRIVDILEKIFAPFTIAGGWLTEAAELYILGKEPMAEESYLQDKDFDVKVNLTSDNYISDTLGVGVTADILFPEITVDFNNVIDNDQGAFATVLNSYHIIDTGTHYFTAIVRPAWTATSRLLVTINSQRLYVRIKRLRGATTVTLFEQQVDFVATDILDAITYTQVTGWMHFEAGDYVWVTVQMAQNLTNDGGSTQTIAMFLATTTEFKLTWDNRCLCLGVGATISAEEMLPDVSRLDFIKALKEAYNLRFNADLMNQVVYIESYDDTMSANEKTLDKTDHSSIQADNVSSNYNSVIKLKLRADTGDRAVTDYLFRNAEPYVKQISLSSVYTKKGIDIWENSLFAYTQNESLWFMSTVITCLRMWADEEYPAGQYYPEYRVNSFHPRLLNWDGLTSGVTWYFNGAAKTTYPKASTVDMTAVYGTNFIKTFHLIDKGKIVKLNIALDLTFLQQFITVVNAVGSEGFRVLYNFQIGAETYSGYINKIEFNSARMLIELIIKN